MTLSGVAGKVPVGPLRREGIYGALPTIRLYSIPDKAGTVVLSIRVGTSLYQPLKRHIPFACFPSRPALYQNAGGGICLYLSFRDII